MAQPILTPSSRNYGVLILCILMHFESFWHVCQFLLFKTARTWQLTAIPDNHIPPTPTCGKSKRDKSKDPDDDMPVLGSQSKTFLCLLWARLEGIRRDCAWDDTAKHSSTMQLEDPRSVRPRLDINYKNIQKPQDLAFSFFLRRSSTLPWIAKMWEVAQYSNTAIPVSWDLCKIPVPHTGQRFVSRWDSAGPATITFSLGIWTLLVIFMFRVLEW